MATTIDQSMLGTFQKHIEDMRNLSLCKICIKPFYEPFILACGHTYCYSCLASWFGGGQNRKRNKNCPDCRAPVTVQPSPNYLLRDLSHMFIGRAELLPEDETLEEHRLGRQEEAGLLAADRAGPGLFKGVFAARPQPLRMGGGILDVEDNVIRCPDCHWELEDGTCAQCGFHDFEADGSDTDSELDSEDLESIMSGATEYDDEGNPIDHEFDATMHTGFHYYDSDTDRSHVHGDFDDDEDMHEFIDDGPDDVNEDEEEDDDDASEATMTRFHRPVSTTTMARRQPLYFPNPIPYATRDREVAPPAYFSQPDLYQRRNPRSPNDDEQSEANTNYEEYSGSEDDTPAPAPKRRRVQRVVISDDEDDEDDDDDDEHQAESAHQDFASNSERESGDEGDGTSGESSPHTANTSGSMSGEDQELTDSNNEEDATEEGDSLSESEESEDTAIRPAQSALRRRAYLQNHRARRGLGTGINRNWHNNNRQVSRGARVY